MTTTFRHARSIFETMTRKSTFIILISCLIGVTALAQGERPPIERRFMAELSSVFLDYQGLQTGQIFKANTFTPGITMGAHAYLSPRFNLSSGVSFVPELRYPMESDRMVTTSLIDVNIMTRMKIRNLSQRPDALMVPFVAAGLGMNSASNNMRIYVPVSMGLKLQLQENFAIMLQSTYKQGFGKGNVQHLAHTVGFVFGIPGTEIIDHNRTFTPDAPLTDSAMLAAIVDTDQDGIPDRNDLCKDKPGMAMSMGCPIDHMPETVIDSSAMAVGKDKSFELPAPKSASAQQAQVTDITSPGVSTPAIEETPDKTETVEFKRISGEDIEIVRRAMDRIYFEPGSDRLTNESQLVLNDVAQVLRRNPEYHLDVRGHADEVNDPDPKQTLPVTRAFAVKRYICYEQQIPYARVYSDGKTHRDTRMSTMGNSRPENRRVDLDLIAPDHVGYRGQDH
jgi:OOP family OmpA-OmpF porin